MIFAHFPRLACCSHPLSSLGDALLGKYGAVVAYVENSPEVSPPSEVSELPDGITLEKLPRQLCQHIIGTSPKNDDQYLVTFIFFPHIRNESPQNWEDRRIRRWQGNDIAGAGVCSESRLQCRRDLGFGGLESESVSPPRMWGIPRIVNLPTLSKLSSSIFLFSLMSWGRKYS